MIRAIVATLGIKANDTYLYRIIEQRLSTLKHQTAFTLYVEQNFNNAEYKYQTAYQKFISLFQKYSAIEFEVFNKEKILDAKKQSIMIANKVREYQAIIENGYRKSMYDKNSRKIEFKNICNQGTKVCVFADEELELLESIGSAYRCIMIQKQISGRDRLGEKLHELCLAKLSTPKQLGNKRVQALIGKVKEVVK